VNMLYFESISKLIYDVNNDLAPKNITDLFTEYSGGARPHNLGGGHMRGKLIFWGGIFKKVPLFAHAVVTGLLAPPPLGISNTLGISPPFRIFAPPYMQHGL
jgi:hypothetical protein